MPIVINQNVSNHNVSQVAAQVATPVPVALQPGSVISARVLQVLGNNSVQIAIGGQTLEVQSQVPLQAGQSLQLAVSQTTDGIRLAIVDPQTAATASQGSSVSANGTAAFDTVTLAPDAAASIAALATSAVAAPGVQLTAQEALAVVTAAQSAATQQTSLVNLFADLGVAAGLDTLPAPVQQAIAQVLTQQLSLDQNLTGPDIQQAFQSSGLFLEASLASGSVSSTSTPDLKAALIVLRQVLTTSLASATAVPTVLATPGTTATPGAIAALLQQGTIAVAGTVQQDVATLVAAQPGVPIVVVQPGATTAVVVAQDATAVAIVLEQGTQPSVQVTLEPVTITAPTETLVTTSPALAPLLASETAISQAPLQAAAVPVPAAAALNISALSAAISPASTATDAAALAAATSAALTQLQEAVQSGPLTGANLSRLVFNNGAMMSLIAAEARPPRVDEAEFARANVPPPPIRGALPTAQAVVPSMLLSNTPAETAMHHLAADLDGAIARQTLLQVASLPDRVDPAGARADTSGPRWTFEIPFLTPRGTTIAQFEISRDDGGNETEAASRVWRARFSLNVEPAGPVHAVISFSSARTSVRMWAERPGTAAQLRAGAGELSQALSRAELVPGDIVIRDGTPPQAAPAKAGHFLDRAL
jgi:Flagellar hook-length control protein FliK